MESEMMQHIMAKDDGIIIPDVNKNISSNNSISGNIRIEAISKNFLSVEERIKALQLEISKLRSTSSIQSTSTREKDVKTPEKLFKRDSPANDQELHDSQRDDKETTLFEPERPMIKLNDANSVEKSVISENNHSEEKEPNEMDHQAIKEHIITNTEVLSEDKNTDFPLKSENTHLNSQTTLQMEPEDKEGASNIVIESEIVENKKPQKMPEMKEEESQQNHEETNENTTEKDNTYPEQVNEPVPINDEISTVDIRETWDETDNYKYKDDVRHSMKCSISNEGSDFVPVSQMHLVLHSIKEGTSLMNEILNQLKRANDILISSFSH